MRKYSYTFGRVAHALRGKRSCNSNSLREGCGGENHHKGSGALAVCFPFALHNCKTVRLYAYGCSCDGHIVKAEIALFIGGLSPLEGGARESNLCARDCSAARVPYGSMNLKIAVLLGGRDS